MRKKIASGDYCEDNYFTELECPVLNIAGRRRIIDNCLYGVDINPEAVEVTKMSLCLKLIDNYHQVDFAAVGLLGLSLIHI